MEMRILGDDTASASKVGLAEFDLRAGREELRCAVCGYGVIVSRRPPACPMCQGSRWDEVGWRSFARADRGRAAVVAGAR